MFLIKYYYLEIRARFYYCIFAFSLVFLSTYTFIENFFYLLILPIFAKLDKNISNDLQEANSFTNKFIFTDISEAFQTSIQLSFFISLFLILPFLLYNIWSFFIPSLYNFERRKFTIDCIIFFFIYLLATYLSINIIFPFFWKFFLNFQEINNLYELECQPRISSYISFLFYIILASQILCLFPFLFFLLLKYNYLNIEQIIKKRSLIYLVLLICISILSPPEITSQFFLLFTCIFFFEVSVSIQLISKKF